MRAAKHPSEATLALHAGGDLGPIARWRAERHIRQCETCQDEILAFQDMRRMVADLSEMPDVPWNRLAAEMQANIRLGLAAGECVREDEPRAEGWRWFTGARALAAAASVVVLVAAGVMLEKPAPRQQTGGIVAVQTQAPSAAQIAIAPGTERDMYVDPLTGNVTVSMTESR
jgi:hypothetical protein